MIALWAIGCARPAAVFSAVDGPAWPPAPDPARVAFTGSWAWAGLARPLDVACGGGRLAVADPEAGVVWVVDRAARRRISVPGGPGAPRAPVGVSLDADGVLWVADADRVVSLAPGARRWRGVDGTFERPTAAAPLPGGAVVVVDAAAHAVVWVDRSGAGAPVGGRGELGVGFNFPVDAVDDGAGGVWVVDALNAAIQRVDRGGGPPVFVAGGPGEGGGALVRPKGVAVDEWGQLHVVDAGMQHVQVYRPDGTLVGRYAGPGELALPSGICIDGRTVYVADSLDARIAVFELVEAP